MHLFLVAARKTDSLALFSPLVSPQHSHICDVDEIIAGQACMKKSRD